MKLIRKIEDLTESTQKLSKKQKQQKIQKPLMSGKRTLKSGPRLPRELKKQTSKMKYQEEYLKTGSNAETEVSLRRSHSTMKSQIHSYRAMSLDVTNDITGIS